MIRFWLLTGFVSLAMVYGLFANEATELTPSFTASVPMRDGTSLPTDIYLPADTTRKYPCVLVRSPAGRTALPWRALAYLSTKGYAVALQGTRSGLDSEGKTFPFFHDGWGDSQDGYDSVEWLAATPWCDGRVVTAGVSAAGITQMMMAPAAPPSLVTQHIGMAAASLYQHATYPGGQFCKNQVEGWLAQYAKDPSVVARILSEREYNDFWQKFDSLHSSDKVTVPALFYTGWYDTFLQGTLDAFTARQERGANGARGKQKIVIGPWTHYWPHDMRLGDFTVPEEGRLPPWDISPHVWFDALLYQEKAMLNAIPAVTYYVMGSFDDEPHHGGHRWKNSASWPPPAQEQRWRLSGDGALVTEAMSCRPGRRHYCHDVANPVPTVGGCNLFMQIGPKDQRPIEGRDDVLVYTSPPLVDELEIAGSAVATLWCGSSLPEYGLDVRLCDVYPDGRSILICEGFMHIRNQRSDGAAQRCEVRLWDTAMAFAKGHRLRIIISSSNYPRYHLDAPTASTPKPHVTIYSGNDTPSQIILPVADLQTD